MQRDVDPRQQEKQDAWLRERTEAERAQLVSNLWRSGRRISEINVRNRFPDASVARVRWLVAELLYGASAARRLLGECPP